MTDGLSVNSFHVVDSVITSNYVESYKWVKLVASKDRRLARKVLPLVAAKLTQEQLAEG